MESSVSPEEGLGYLEGTIRTYNQGVQKFAEAIDKKRLDNEMTIFTQNLPQGGKVLDAGCGYGRDAALLKERGYELIGTDLSTAFIEEAKRRFPEIEFKLMDIRHLDFEDESFDGIWARAVLLHLTLEDISQSLGEFNRVLKPDGTAFIYMKEGEGSEVKEESFTAQGERHFTYVCEAQLKEMLEAAGFTVDNIYTHNEREVFGPEFRDLEWVCAFAKK